MSIPVDNDNVLIQVRARLREHNIKLWLEPYYSEGAGSVAAELDRLAEEYSSALGLPMAQCKQAVAELQDGALRKLEARKVFSETGQATFSIRSIRSNGSSQGLANVTCSLAQTGRELFEAIVEQLKVSDINRIKVISGGRIVSLDQTLSEQGLSNNQQLMVIISESAVAGNDNEDAMYQRVQKVKTDVEKIVNAEDQNLLEMEDQDGNAIHLPPKESKALMMGLAFYEKGKAALKREQYDEALILLLEADQQFASCTSGILSSVDNYALLNLDIVWCYLCLKNLTQLPDAQRRLDICEKTFRKSYGENMNRVMALKGNADNEKALMLRLHLLQGIVLFHQNSRSEALKKLTLAERELQNLKVDELALTNLMEMGYTLVEARVSLRSCNGNVNRAMSFINDKRKRKRDARDKNRRERSIKDQLAASDDGKWVNPRTVSTLVEMGYQADLAAEALKRTNNDLARALDMLHTSSHILAAELPKPADVEQSVIDQLTSLGFNADYVRAALEFTRNNPERAVDFLLQMQNEDDVETLVNTLAETDNEAGPSTSAISGEARQMLCRMQKRARANSESMKAYQRFAEDVASDEEEYLDLDLVQEEEVINEYKAFLLK